MKKYVTLFALLFSCAAHAHEIETSPISAHITPDGAAHAGTRETLEITLSDSKGPVPPGALKTVHTKPMHFLVVDSSLEDYQHLHPVADSDGKWHVDFTPKHDGSYIAWADITLKDGDKHYYLKNILGAPLKKMPINRQATTKATIDGYEFTLNLEPLKAGQASMGSVSISKDGKPVTALEPVMGAFAHIVAFSEDLDSILHVHPMGTEPTSEKDRGGPTLEFHIEPEHAGFIKLFVQTKIDGKDVFAPFGAVVK